MTDQHNLTHTLLDQALALGGEIEKVEETETLTGDFAQVQGQAQEAERERVDSEASGWIGAQVGNLSVLRRERPGKRWIFVCRDHRRPDEEIRLRGFELVDAARVARANGLPVTGLRTPWRNETPV